MFIPAALIANPSSIVVIPVASNEATGANATKLCVQRVREFDNNSENDEARRSIVQTVSAVVWCRGHH